LFKTKYAGLCVLGTEIFCFLCIGYGLLLSGKAMDLQHSLFELITWFVWGTYVSFVWGALYLGVVAWIMGWYIAWMHNASLIPSIQ
jgi:hypothetical protein